MSELLSIQGDEPTIGGAGEVSLDELADLFTRTYTDYVIPVHVDQDRLSWTISTQTIDLAASRIVRLGEEPVAFIFMASRGLSQRVAAMGVLPEHRDHGVGRWMLTRALDAAKERGYRRILLEVIDGNDSALALYRKLGFQVTRRLAGYRRETARPDQHLITGALEVVDPREVAKAIVHDGEPNLPWQRSADSFFTMQPPTQAFHLERSAYAIVSELRTGALHLDALLVPRAKRRQGWGTRILQALFDRWPERDWLIHPTVPEELAPGFFRANRFRQDDIRQFEMVLELG
jgi:GNAT superfamily N-acetyltransferase